ncbi:Aste57867_19034 [Aphanomyces stellatus]|uniref:Aste57867_19034 protein n=1 Tax=Aphanomyces stellatus TaxID=120398 RepID=A0A485LFV7_9STRA|nr:hypothetical protein As57867_018970 [Aphanomyces stellatus]VFT95759.1 Aste57867_19034 [Aphanomyces stellatus]
MSAPIADADVMPMFFLNPGGPSVSDKKEEDASSPTKSSYANLQRPNYQNPWESNGLDHQYQSLRKRKGGFSADASTSSVDVFGSETSPSIPTNSLFASLSSKLDTRPPAAAASTTSSTNFLFPSLQAQEWGCDEVYWITVFGFPIQEMDAVFSYFQTLGDVVQYRYGRGNWLYVRYRTRLQAEKALHESGSTLGGRVMIGTKRCLAWEMDADAPVINITDHHAPPAPLLSRDLQVNPPEVDIMESPRRQDDVCSRFLRFLFNV